MNVIIYGLKVNRMKRIMFLMILAMLPAVLSAQSRKDSLDLIAADAAASMDSIVTDYNDYAQETLQQYLEYENALREEYKEYIERIKAEWGDEEVVESSRKVWVEYSDDESFRTIVDFETGKVDVEVLSDPSDSQQQREEKIRQALETLLSSRGRSVGYNSKVAKDEPITKNPILEGMLDLSAYGIASDAYPVQGRGESAPIDKSKYNLNKGKSLSINRGSAGRASEQGSMASIAERKREEELRRQEELRLQEEQRKKDAEAAAKAGSEDKLSISGIASVIADKAKLEKETVKTSNGTKDILKIELQLVEDHIPKRAAQFKELVKANSAKFTVDQPLIFAIMEQESAFNPAAKSHVPAYGLMQLVPTSGGRDAYRYVHKQDVIPSANFLYDPSNNVELGTAYLRLLMTTSFAKVKDARCRMLCAIAAYNTGAGNVSRALIGSTNVSKAIDKINSMTFDQLFSYLRSNLPHAETRDYIQKVTSKMEKYMK